MSAIDSILSLIFPHLGDIVKIVKYTLDIIEHVRKLVHRKSEPSAATDDSQGVE